MTDPVTAYAVVMEGVIDRVCADEESAKVRQAALDVEATYGVEVVPVDYYGLPPISLGPTERGYGRSD